MRAVLSICRGATAPRMRSAPRGATRTPPFSTLVTALRPSDIADLSALCVTPGAALTSPADILPYNTDWMRTTVGASPLVLLPASTAQVSAVLALCNARRIGVVPQGGNTGLVGGGVPRPGEEGVVILSTARMNKVLRVDPFSGTVAAQAGVRFRRGGKGGGR